LTSSSPSKDEDSFRKTAMSRREDILGCIDVTINEGAHDMREKRRKRTEMRDARRYTSPALKAGVSREELR
jgi:hypothetical protein